VAAGQKRPGGAPQGPLQAGVVLLPRPLSYSPAAQALATPCAHQNPGAQPAHVALRTTLLLKSVKTTSPEYSTTALKGWLMSALAPVPRALPAVPQGEPMTVSTTPLAKRMLRTRLPMASVK
jgi:hypothetical protein